MDIFEQQIQQIKTSIGCLEELSPLQKRSLLEALDELSYTLPVGHIVTQEPGTSQDEFIAMRQALEAERMRSLKLEKQIEERTAALSQANEQLTQLNAQLEQQVQARTSELEQMLNFEAMLKRITDKVRDSLDESQIVQTVLQELTQVLGIEGCDTALYDTEETISTISYESARGVPSKVGRVIPIADFAEEYRQLQQGLGFQFCKLETDFRGPVAILACPIFDNHEVLGDLLLFKQREESFDQQEIRLAQQVANQCAIAIRQVRLYQAAQAQVTELEKLNQLKDDFLSTVSHELRTPVTNMKMAIHMLAKALNQDQSLFAELSKPETQRSKIARYFHILLNECERETNLINDLLDLQRLETGVHPILPTTIDLRDWLPQLLGAFEQRTQNRQQRLEVNISPNLPLLVCDAASLGRIMTELLNNACKYTPPQEKIKVTAQAQAGIIQMSVSNTGIEISANELSLIFDKFYRIPKADRWQQGGTGLGLALVQKLVTRLGGTIQAKSGFGQTSFTIELPLVLNPVV
ncbi:MAG TPA: ATP-binding protein [Coleofasciculaceae cyanobacterium]